MLVMPAPHLRRSSSDLSFHLLHRKHRFTCHTFCFLPHSYQPDPFMITITIVVQSPHLYVKSETDEAPGSAKLNVSRPFLSCLCLDVLNDPLSGEVITTESENVNVLSDHLLHSAQISNQDTTLTRLEPLFVANNNNKPLLFRRSRKICPSSDTSPAPVVMLS